MTYKLEKRQQGRDLFVESGMSYEAVAKKTGVSPSVLKEWGRKNGWAKQRREFTRDGEAINEKRCRLELFTYNDLVNGLEGGRMRAHDVHARIAILRTILLQKIISGVPDLVETVRRLECVSGLLGKMKRKQ